MNEMDGGVKQMDEQMCPQDDENLQQRFVGLGPPDFNRSLLRMLCMLTAKYSKRYSFSMCEDVCGALVTIVATYGCGWPIESWCR